MAIAVKSRPNHYELLGLAPTATSDEIAQAFAKALSLLTPRPFGSLADITVAYETLRNPTKRKAYDASIGLGLEPLRPAPKAPADWKPFLAKPREAVVCDRPQSPKLPTQPHALLQRLEQRPAPVSTATMRQPIRPEARKIDPAPTPKPDPSPQPEPGETAAPEPTVAGHRALHLFEGERVKDAGISWSNWKLPAAAGALVLAVVVGGWAGWAAGNDSEPASGTATITVPAARTVPDLADPAGAAVSDIGQAPPKRQTRAAAGDRIARDRSSRDSARATQQQREAAKSDQTQPTEIATEEQSAGSSAAPPTSAKMPLPNDVVARTIGRIGYSCGQVASATAMGSGVFKVTCTSGDSYRAAPVRGRYHFRRLGSR